MKGLKLGFMVLQEDILPWVDGMHHMLVYGT